MEGEPKEPTQEELEGRANELLDELEGLKERYYDRVSSALQERWYYATLALDASQDLATAIEEARRVLVDISTEILEFRG